MGTNGILGDEQWRSSTAEQGTRRIFTPKELRGPVTDRHGTNPLHQSYTHFDSICYEHTSILGLTWDHRSHTDMVVCSSGKKNPQRQLTPGVTSHLVRRAVLLSAAGGCLLVIFARVHHLTLGALSDQMSANARNIFEAVTCRRGEQRDFRPLHVHHKQRDSLKPALTSSVFYSSSATPSSNLGPPRPPKL